MYERWEFGQWCVTCFMGTGCFENSAQSGFHNEFSVALFSLSIYEPFIMLIYLLELIHNTNDICAGKLIVCKMRIIYEHI